MDKDIFYTIANLSQGFYTEKSSKFLAFAYPVNSESEIKTHLNKLKKKYFDARHHVYAFYLGEKYDNFRASDDGEPANSSGPSVLGQIRSFNLTNILIVVVRYFGGTKLGISGLINAYKNAAKNAIENSEIIEKYIENKIEINFDYEEINFVMKCIKDNNATILIQDFKEKCKIIASIRLSLHQTFINCLKQNHRIQTMEFKNEISC